MKVTDREDSSFHQAVFETKLGDAVFEPIKVEYIDHMGSDKRVCNVARVSMDKWEDESEPLSERDVGLLNYLPLDVQLKTGMTMRSYTRLLCTGLHSHTVPYQFDAQFHSHWVTSCISTK